MASTRNSPSLSPTNTVLPLIMAEGRVGLKTMPWSRRGTGLGGGGVATGAALVGAVSWALAGSGLVEVAVRVDAAAVTGADGGTGGATRLGGTGDAGTPIAGSAGTETGRGSGVAAATGAMREFPCAPLAKLRVWAHCQTRSRAKRPATANAAN